MRRALAGLVLMSVSCTDWQALSAAYEGDGVCPAYVIAGDTHSCVRKSSGSLFCWGDNRFGQLGTGDTAKRPTPTRIALPTGTSKLFIPTGEGDIEADLGVFTCAVLTDNSLSCWGDDRFGQLGVGTTEAHAAPVAVGGITNVARAALGAGHACAQDAEGVLSCWGRNQYGQLGTGDKEPRSAPTRVKLDGFVADKLNAGGGFTCARSPDATLYCWGDNRLGQLGLGNNDAALVPTKVTALAGKVARFSTGASHACALDDLGAATCWGDNRYGQLGTGDMMSHNAPVSVTKTDLGNVTQLALGGRHSCAIRSDGALFCWGDNRSGQLGTGDTSPHLVPVRVGEAELGTQVSVVYAGGAHTCALKSDGSVWCWGSNQYGQLGVEVGPLALSPRAVLGACH